MIKSQSSGLVAPSATNPLDEVPIGPQVFPFGTPTAAQSQVNPYTATNYQAGQTAQNVIQSTTQAYPATAYQSSATQILDTGAYQTSEVIPTTYQNASVQQGVIDASAYNQLGEAVTASVGYQTVPTTSLTNGYQTVVNYKPVTKTVMVPKVVTKYVPMPVNSSVTGPMTNSMFQETPLPPVPIGRGDHYVSNYPIYENDPRRIGRI